MTYTISYEKNGVYQAIGVNAQTAEQAAAYFAQYKPTAHYIGIREGMDSKPGFPVITVPADFQEAAEEAQQESTLDKVTAELKARKDRSAWDKGITVYALELVEELKERAAYEGRNPEPGAECKAWLLNGAQDWEQYSYGGSALIYDGDIATRLCCPSELKKNRDGERNPNSRETWLDVQARALSIACNRVTRLYRQIVREG